MKLIHITDYKLYNKNIINNLKLAIINDLHFSYKVTDKILQLLLKQLTKEQPNYILMPGDLIDSIGMIDQPQERERLLDWIKKLGMIGTTLISIGNHDQYVKERTLSGKKHWSFRSKIDFFDDINDISNVYVLDNSFYEDNNLYVVGYTQSVSYYHTKNRASLLKPGSENKEQMLKELSYLNPKLLHNLPKNKIKLILIHSPVYLTNKEVLSELQEFDYFISGHMHNGCVPPILNELWNSSKGIIAPDRTLFPDNERNTLKKKEDKLLVNGPVVTFQECTGLLQIFNSFYPKYMSIMNFSSDKSYDTFKLHITKKYVK